ncbi:hypothetical protein DSO57_1010469 [Entomophthora muscae]|uniref:Uncharacterized protein n=1 Tax=Entomophthora muscae TaxID=34485 RepID=A0ACC2TU09_9FUNG|nr:hypothetical protein DSO57_1010469 [Entomophthora muscae]
MLLARNISILIFSGDDDFISNPASLLKIHAELARNLSPKSTSLPKQSHPYSRQQNTPVLGARFR